MMGWGRMPIERLPARYRPAARSLRDWLMTDKGLLLILAMFCAMRSVGYTRIEDRTLLQHALEIGNDWISPALWIVLTVLCVVSVVLPECQKLEIVALSAVVGAIALWGMLYIQSSPPGLFSRGSAYITIALLVVYTLWRGDSTRVRIRGEDTHD